MESQVRRPGLIVFPLGLLATATIFDLVTLWSGNPKWTGMAFWMIAAGILSGLIAAVFEFMDWTAIPAGTQANCVGMYHGAGNILVVGFFAASWMLRRPSPDRPEAMAYVFSFLGAGLALATAWMCGDLVNSLTRRMHSGANPHRA